MDITTIFNQFAFPTAVVMALMWYIVTTNKSHREDMKAKDEQIERLVNVNTEQNEKSTKAISDLTVAITELTTWLKKGECDHEQQ